MRASASFSPAPAAATSGFDRRAKSTACRSVRTSWAGREAVKANNAKTLRMNMTPLRNQGSGWHREDALEPPPFSHSEGANTGDARREAVALSGRSGADFSSSEIAEELPAGQAGPEARSKSSHRISCRSDRAAP